MDTLTDDQVAAGSDRHVVQCYGADTEILLDNVAQYLAAGAARGDSLLVIATPAHADALVSRPTPASEALQAARRDSRLVVLDARRTLDALLIDGQPDRELFDAVVGGAVRTLQARRAGAHVRMYGEMVGLLWSAWHFGDAIRLEDYWNRLLSDEGLSLFCAYPIDVFGPEFDPTLLHDLLCAHTRLLPTTPNLEAAVARAMDEVLGSAAPEQRLRMTAHMPAGAVRAGEAQVLWLRANLGNRADEILDYARRHCARLPAA